MGQDLFPSSPAPSPSTPLGGADLFPAASADPLARSIDAVTIAPSEAARIFDLRLKTGLAPAVIQRHLPEIEQDAARRDFDAEAYRTRNPKVAAWMADPVTAALARDDLAGLSTIEHTLTFGESLLKAWQNTKAEFGGSFPAAVSHLLGQEGAARTFEREAARYSSEGTLYGPSTSITAIRGPWDLAQYLKETAGEVLPMMGPTIVGGAVGAGATLSTWGAVIGATVPSFIQNVGDVQQSVTEARASKVEASGPQTPRETAAVWMGGSAVAALDTVLPERLGSRLVSTFGRETAEAIARRALETPVKPKWILATATGAVRGASTEGLTEALQQAIQDVATAAGTGTPLDVPQMAWNALEAGAKGAVMGGAAEGVTEGAAARHEAARHAAALHQQQFFEALGQGVTDSTIAQTLPPALEELLQRATKDGPVEHVYAPIDTFESYWQSKGINPALIAQELTGSPTAFEEAKALGPGGLLQIPTAAYAAKLAATEHHAYFAPELKLDPTLLNAREVDEFQQRLETFAGEQRAAAAPDLEEAKIAIYQRVYDRAVELGNRPEVADAWAGLYANRYTTRAATLGIDPIALYDQVVPRITSEMPVPSEATTPRLEIPASEASPNETPAQRSTRRTVHLAALTNVLLRDAQQLDPTVSRATIARALDQRMALEDERLAAEHEAGTGRALLEAIASNGGVWFDAGTGLYKGEIERLALEGGDRNVSTRRARSGIGRESYSTGKTWNGVAGVFNEGGKTLDGMVEALREDPRFRNLTDINELLDRIEQALASTETKDQFPGSADLADLGIDPRVRWWTQGPAEFAQRPQTLEQLAAAGFDTSRVYYHQTAAVNVEPITRDGFDVSIVGARNNDEQVPDGVFFKPDTRDIGLGAADAANQAQIGVYLRLGKTLEVENRGALADHLQRDARYRELADEARRHDEARSREFDQAWNRLRERDRTHPETAEANDREIDTLLETWKAENAANAAAARARATEVLRAEGYESVHIRVDVGSLGRRTETFITFAGNQVALARENNPVLYQVVDATPGGLFDTLDTGEQQARLPGAESARQAGKASTTFRAPQQATAQDFELTPPSPAPKASDNQGELFQRTRAVLDARARAAGELYQGAYHGSPHIFERFDLTKIGSGEGAQVYGYGLYFTSEKSIAQYYREQLAGKPKAKSLTYDGVDVWDRRGLYQKVVDAVTARDIASGAITHPTTQNLEAQDVFPPEWDVDRLRQGLLELHARTYYTPPGRAGLVQVRINLELSEANLELGIKTEGRQGYSTGDLKEDVRKLDEVKAALYALNTFGENLYITPPETPGRVYTVDIPGTETFLDWDKPLDEQPPMVRDALRTSHLARVVGMEAHQEARALFLDDLDARAGDRANEARTIATRMLDTLSEREGDTSEDNWRTLVAIVGRGFDLNRIHQIADYGVDDRYVETQVDAAIQDEAVRRFDEWVDRIGFDLDTGIRVDVRETDDPEFPFDVVDGREVIDAYDNRAEAEQAAIALEDQHRAQWERDMVAEFAGQIDRDTMLARVREELGLAVGRWGIETFRRGLTGEAIYERLAEETSPKEASEQLRALGVNGISYVGESSGVQNFVVFDDGLVQILEYEQRDELRAEGGGDVKGAFNPATNTIRLVAGKADLSTFLHESGHAFLEELLADASLDFGEAPTAQQQRLRTDAETVLRWFGFKGSIAEWRALPVDQRRDMHEQFARGFEAYLMTGQAPSVELRGIFARFRAWLVGLYRDLRNLRVDVTPEIRGVMDRLLASGDAIAAAEAEAQVTPLPAEAFPTPASFDDYRRKFQEARQAALEALDKRMLADYRREKEAWYRGERDVVRAGVITELMAQPAFVAQSVIRTGKMPDGSIPPFGDGRPIKLSKADVVKAYGAEMLKRLPKPYLYAVEGGLPVDTVAELTGFPTGDALIKALLETPRIDRVIEQETDARMREKHGDLLTDDLHVREAAEGAVQDQRLDVVLDELRTLQAKVSTAKAALPSRALLDQGARTQIARTTVRDLRPGVFLIAAQRAGVRAFERAAAGVFTEAVQAKQQEAFSLALYRAARDAKEQAQAWRVELQRFDTNPATRARIGKAGQDYLDQIDRFLERYEFTRVTLKDIDRRESLRQFVDRQKRLNIPVDIPDEVLDDARRVNWQELSVEELAGVREAVLQIAHLARLKTKLLKIAKARELAEVTTELATSIRDHGTPRPKQLNPRRPSEQGLGKMLEGASAAHRKIASLAREGDGFQDGGPMWDYLIRPLNEAANREATMQAEATEQLRALFDRYTPTERARWYAPEYEPALGALADPLASITKAERLVVALNWGTEKNRQRMRDGRGWTDAQVQAILNRLDRRDWDFVQAAWDYVGSYWPEIKAKQERVYGVAPPKEEAVPVLTRFGDYRGGYLPIKFEGQLASLPASHEEGQFAELARAAAYRQASPRRGFTKARADSPVTLPVRLDFGVLFEHVGEVIHDVTHHEALVDVQRVLGHDDVNSAIRDVMGDQVLRQFNNTLRDVALGSVPARDMVERLVNHVRTGTTVVGLGFRFTTALMQPLGFTQSIARIGPTWVAKGLTSWLGDPTRMRAKVREIYAKSEFMRTRGLTLNREINEVRNQVGLDTGRGGAWVDAALRGVTADRLTKAAIADSYFWAIGFTQKMVDVPTWLGAYEKALADPANVLEDGTVDEARAIALADQAVIDSQGSGAIKDLASVQRGSAYLKLWTNFYSYFNVTYNLWTESYRDAKRRRTPEAIGRLAIQYLLLFAIPASLGTALRDLLKGEDDPDRWISHLWRENVAYPLSSLMIGRELASGVEGFDYTGPAGVRPLVELNAFLKQATASVEAGENKITQRVVDQLIDAGGAVTHIPTGQIRLTIEGLAAYMEGKTTNPAAIVVGP